MRDIRRPDSSETLVERLTTGDPSEKKPPVFTTIMDLLIFAAGVGFKVGRRVPVPAAGKAVPFRVFENNQKEGFIYLLALAEKKDPSALLVENDDESARTFEEYAAGGLDEIQGWVSMNALDTSGVQALLNAIQEQIPAVAIAPSNPSPL